MSDTLRSQFGADLPPDIVRDTQVVSDRLLNQITTRWSIVIDPSRLMVRYASAIRSYLEAILRDGHAADEVAQNFAIQVLENSFDSASPGRGRFRDYVKVSARNAALSYLRRRKRAGRESALTGILEKTLADPAGSIEPTQAASDEWLGHWRRCLLDKVWRALESHELRSPSNLFHTALKLSVDFPGENSEALGVRAAEQTGRPIRADAFRKQLSRARQMFAELLVEEVAATLIRPTPADVDEELVELGLMSYLRAYLPDIRSEAESA